MHYVILFVRLFFSPLVARLLPRSESAPLILLMREIEHDWQIAQRIFSVELETYLLPNVAEISNFALRAPIGIQNLFRRFSISIHERACRKEETFGQ